MMKLIALRLLTTGLPTLIGMVGVTCYHSGMQQGLRDAPPMLAGAVIASVAMAVLVDWRKARRLRRA